MLTAELLQEASEMGGRRLSAEKKQAARETFASKGRLPLPSGQEAQVLVGICSINELKTNLKLTTSTSVRA